MPESDTPGNNLYYARDVRELDRLAIEEHGIDGYILMQRAGRAAFDELVGRWPGTRAVTVFCGGGNNGGDGYVVAALAREYGLESRVLYVRDPARLTGSARRAYDHARSAGVAIQPFDPAARAKLEPDTILVDALLGTGLGGEVRDDYRRAINSINSAHKPVLALDIPSGLDSDTGRSHGATVRASVTVTFIGRKIGTAVGEGPASCGEVVYANLAVPPAIFHRVTPAGSLRGD